MKTYPIDFRSRIPIPFREEVIFITQMDMSKDEGTFKIFPDIEAADKFSHDLSLAQLPEWHKENCNAYECNKEKS
jgi:hypothetical protein